MGLSFIIVKLNKRTRFGSYSLLIELRLFLINASITYLNHLKNKLSKVHSNDLETDDIGTDYCNETITFIQSWINVKNDGYLINDSVLPNPGLDNLYQVSMHGLLKLVNHSDAEGYHSYGDCIDILESLNILESHLEESSRLFKKFKELKGLFELAIENQSSIRYA